MLTGLIVSLLAVQAAPAPAAAKADDADRQICKNVKTTGTRVGRVRVCATKAEWDERERAAVRDAEEASRSSGRQ